MAKSRKDDLTPSKTSAALCLLESNDQVTAYQAAKLFKISEAAISQGKKRKYRKKDETTDS